MIDAQEALGRLYAEHEERADYHHLHVADLTQCPRIVWARLNDRPIDGFDVGTLRKFRKGNNFETEIREAITLAYGEDYHVERDVLVYLAPTPKIGGPSLAGGRASYDQEGRPRREGDGTLLADLFEVFVVGHPDLVLTQLRDEQLVKVVIEVKATSFKQVGFGRDRAYQIPTAPRFQYAVQNAAYAIAEEAQAHVIVGCWISDQVTPGKPPFVFDPWQYAEAILAGFERLKTVRIGGPMPPAQPPDYATNDDGSNWLCKLCRYRECERNPRALELPE